MMIGSRSPEHKCREHGLWLVKVGEIDGIDQLRCPVCMHEDLMQMSDTITQQKIRIYKLEEARDDRGEGR